jgi:hypothetical protein
MYSHQSRSPSSRESAPLSASSIQRDRPTPIHRLASDRHGFVVGHESRLPNHPSWSDRTGFSGTLNPCRLEEIVTPRRDGHEYACFRNGAGLKAGHVLCLSQPGWFTGQFQPFRIKRLRYDLAFS